LIKLKKLTSNSQQANETSTKEGRSVEATERKEEGAKEVKTIAGRRLK
jgi:hypothetical protein